MILKFLIAFNDKFFIVDPVANKSAYFRKWGLSIQYLIKFLLILLLIFIGNKTNIKIINICLILLTRSRAALLMVTYYLLSVPKLKWKIIYGLSCFFAIIIFFDDIIVLTRFAEILNTAVSESQVLQRKLDQISKLSKLNVENIILINPFLHDISTGSINSLWNVIYLPFNYFASLGLIGFIFLASLIVKKKWYPCWIYLSLANLSGVGLWQYFDGTLGPVVYFDGYIFLSLLVIKGMGHEKKSN